MNLLGAKLYDPTTAVSKATSALLAMTAFDTTNLRLTVTVPAHGMLRIRIQTVITGATTVPTIFLGVMNGATVVGRCNPLDYPGTMNATTQTCPAIVDFVVTGLTPGSITLDAAYGVEVIVALTNIKYGGPNNTTTNDAWGAFQYEIWDPQPMEATFATDYTAARAAKLDNLDAAVSTRMATYTQPTGFLAATFPATVASPTNITAGTITTCTNLTNLPSIPANWLTAAGIAAGALNGKGDWLTAAGYTAPDNTTIATLATRLTATRAGNLDNLDAAISTRSTYAGGDTAGTTSLLGRLTAGRALLLDNLSNLDGTVSSRMAAASYTAPDNAGIAAVKGKTDNLAFTVAGVVDAHILYVDGKGLTGTGTEADPWRAP